MILSHYSDSSSVTLGNILTPLSEYGLELQSLVRDPEGGQILQHVSLVGCPAFLVLWCSGGFTGSVWANMFYLLEPC